MNRGGWWDSPGWQTEGSELKLHHSPTVRVAGSFCVCSLASLSEDEEESGVC